MARVGRSLPFLLGLVLWLITPPVEAEWWLWESPTDDEAYVDASQTAFNQVNIVLNGQGVGQSFVPTHDFLYRMDFMLASSHDRRPFTLRLWKWADSKGNVPGCAENVEYADTVAAAPVWQETLSLPGPPVRVLRTFFPRVAVQPGVPYYVEFGYGEPDGQWEVSSNWGEQDLYPSGALRANGSFLYSCAQNTSPRGDLYFRTYYSAGAAPPALTCLDGSAAPCFSAPAPWIWPTFPGAAITAADYRAMIQNEATMFRQGMLGGTGEEAQNFALLDAFLYASGGTAANADYALALLRKGYQWRSAHNGEPVGFDWMEQPAMAYRWLGDYGGLTPQDSALIRSLLLHSATRFWPNRELGAFDHALGGALTYTLLTSLLAPEELHALSTCAVPLPPGYPCLFGPGDVVDAADHAAWKAHADQVWDYFTAHFDFTDDCTNYQFGLDFRYALELDQLRVARGASSIWESTGFRKLVERFYQLLSPLGPAPTYGDTYGWNQNWATPAMLFETAAAQLNDPRYRWAAYRLFDYHRSHIRNTKWNGDTVWPWEAVYNEYPSFALAYFAVDESLPTEVPPPQAESISAQQDSKTSSEWTAGVHVVGQTFQPAAAPLARLELRLDNLGNTAPATIRVWPWNALGYAETVASQPLYEDSMDMSGSAGYDIRSVVPLLDVEPGRSVLIELSRASPFRIQGGNRGADAYPDGALYLSGTAVPSADLWFRAYTLSGGASAVTWRHDVDTLLPSDWGSPPLAQVFGTKDVPDKLILHSGWAPQDLHVVFNLIADFYGNGQAETGALVSLVAGGTPLIIGSSYFAQQDKDEASLLVRRHWGATRADPGDATSVQLRDARLSAFASIRWPDPRGFDLDLERRVLFVKNRFLWVRDGVSFGSEAMVSAGNVWHGYDMHPEHGLDWYTIYNRVPRGLNGFQYSTPEQYLLLRFLDRGYQLEEWEAPYEDNPPTAPFIVGQRWVGTGAAGSSRWFDTLLVPHGPQVAPWIAAAGTTTLYDDGINAAIRVVLDGESWTLVDNPGKASIDTGSLATDASYLIARTTAGVPYLLTREATHVHLQDEEGALIDWTWPVPTSVEFAGGAVACPAGQACGGPSCGASAVGDEQDLGLNSCTPAAGGLLQCGAGKTVHLVELACPPRAGAEPQGWPAPGSGAETPELPDDPADCGMSQLLVCK